MKNKYIFYGLILISLAFPIFLIEDIVPWGVCLYFINKSIKEFRECNDLKGPIKNTVLTGGIILIYHFVVRAIEAYINSMYV